MFRRSKEKKLIQMTVTEGFIRNIAGSAWYRRYVPWLIGIAVSVIMVVIGALVIKNLTLSYIFMALSVILYVRFIFMVQKSRNTLWRIVKDMKEPIDINKAQEIMNKQLGGR